MRTTAVARLAIDIFRYRLKKSGPSLLGPALPRRGAFIFTQRHIYYILYIIYSTLSCVYIITRMWLCVVPSMCLFLVRITSVIFYFIFELPFFLIFYSNCYALSSMFHCAAFLLRWSIFHTFSLWSSFFPFDLLDMISRSEIFDSDFYYRWLHVCQSSMFFYRCMCAHILCDFAAVIFFTTVNAHPWY